MNKEKLSAEALREREIARRLKEVRTHLLISQTMFAMKLEISQPRLAKYEAGTVPLPWSVGESLYRTFGISPVWLGTGKSEMWAAGWWKIDPLIIEALGARPRLSTVVEEFLLPLQERRSPSDRLQKVLNFLAAHNKPSVQHERNAMKGRSPVRPALTPAQAEAWSDFCQSDLRTGFASVKTELMEDFRMEMTRLVRETQRKFSKS